MRTDFVTVLSPCLVIQWREELGNPASVGVVLNGRQNRWWQ